MALNSLTYAHRNEALGSAARARLEPPAILGSLIREWWDARYGVGLVSGEANTWTGQVAGTVLTAAAAGNRLLVEADGSNFNGRAILKSAAAGPRYLRNLAVTPFFLDASRPYVLGVIRVSTHGASNRWAFYMLNAAFSESGPHIVFQTSGATFNGEFGASVAFSADTTVHTLESFINSAGDAVVSVDGTDTTAAGPLSISGDRTQFSIGAAFNGTGPLDVSHASYVCAVSAPSAAQRVELRQWAHRVWGAP